MSSPVKIKVAQTAPTRVGLEKARHNLIRDLDETVPEIPTKFFYDNLLPPNPLPTDTTIEEVVSTLVGQKKIVNGNWEGWKRPSADTDLEDTVFSKFAKLTDNIQKASGIKDKPATIEFECNPALMLTSVTRNNSSKPDCYGIRTDAQLDVDDQTRTAQPRWLDVAIPGEFKKKSDEGGMSFKDNAAKVLWSMNHLMREDARRRFVIGFTIEDVDMRLWYCSRSDVFVSQKFNWQNEHARLVDFVLRVSFADLDALGWDLTVTLLEPRGAGLPVQYDIVVRDQKMTTKRTFRTKRMISSIAADTLRGRGTRVWEVTEVDDKGKEKGNGTYVLKDVWVDDDRQREGDILQAIRDATKAKPKPKKWLELVDQFLLTTVEYGDVRVDDEVDKTRHWAMPEISNMVKVKNEPKEHARVKNHLAPVGGISLEPVSQQPVAQHFATKSHHRIVFKEVGKTIREVESLREAFMYIRQAVRALCALHELGWVHRDISSGNILIVNGRVKLADLEYAKFEDDFSLHGIRTGTIYFMSVEVEHHDYLYRAAGNIEPSSPMDPLSDSEDSEDSDPTQTFASAIGVTETSDQDPLDPEQERTESTAETPFRYNPLHDLESLYWLALFLLFAGRLVSAGDGAVEISAGHRQAQQQLSKVLFCDLAFRMNVMRQGVSRIHLMTLHPRIAEIMILLDGIRSNLTQAFVKSEENLEAPIPFSVAKYTYKGITTKLQEIDRLLAVQDVLVAADDATSERLRGVLAEGPESTGLDDGVDVARPTKKPRTEDPFVSSLSPSSSQLPVFTEPRQQGKRLSTAPK